MKLYHEVRGCSLAVDIVARELEIPLDLIWVDVPNKRLPDGSDYYKINPKGQVPALELPDGQHLSEGAVIMQYLADQRPDRDLIAPAGTLERYRILEWMSFIASDLHKGAFMPLFRKTTPPSRVGSPASTSRVACSGSTIIWPAAISWSGRPSPWPMLTATPS